MLKEWKERRQLRGNVRHLERQLSSIDAPSSQLTEYQKLNEELGAYRDRLAMLNTFKLLGTANRLGVDVPDNKDGWWRSMKGTYPIRILTDIGQAGLRKMIKDERLKTAKDWAGILIPILSLLVALLSLLRK